MHTSTAFTPIDDATGTAEAAGTGRHRGRRAAELLVALDLPGRGRHRRLLGGDHPGGPVAA